jgi:hypothetical protein
MTTDGWIFLGIFWTSLLACSVWSFAVLMKDPDIPFAPFEDDTHPLSCEVKTCCKSPEK